MSLLAYLQITYLVINLVGIIVNLVFITCEGLDCDIISIIFSFISKYLGNIALVIISILLIILFLPTLTVVSALFAFTSLWGAYSR